MSQVMNPRDAHVCTHDIPPPCTHDIPPPCTHDIEIPGTVTKVNILHAVSKPAVIGGVLHLNATTIPAGFDVQTLKGMKEAEAVAVASAWPLPGIAVAKVDTSFPVQRPYVIRGTLYVNVANVPEGVNVNSLVGKSAMEAMSLATEWSTA